MYAIDVPDPKDRKTATDANLDQTFTFEGWVDFPPGAGELLLAADDDGDSYSANGVTLIRTFQPSSTTKNVGGRLVWTFALGPLAPFRAVVDRKPLAQPWRDGGTARINIYARRFSDGAVTSLRARDSDGVNGNEYGEVTFADGNATPETQNNYSTPLYPVPDYLGKKDQTGNVAETLLYYLSVSTAYDGRTDGMAFPRRSIWNELQTLQAFKSRYFFGVSGQPPNLRVYPATYFNKGDLGIGRKMHCSYDNELKVTACFVENYGSPDGSPLFTDDKGPSERAIEAKKPFATVAMVSRGAMAQGAPNKVFFAVYGANGALALEAPLDNRGYNTFIPGNCLVCHGTAARYDKGSRQVYGAYFLPFDLEHGFDYYGTSSLDPLSRAAQEDKFRTLNTIVAKTNLYTLPYARALLNGFYGASDTQSPNDWSSTFQNGWVPRNWNSIDGRQIYKKVVAGYCRTCHISYSGGIQGLEFGTYADFGRNGGKILDAVCGAPAMNSPPGTNIMPNAEVTSNAFWRSDARAQLTNRFFLQGCGLLGPRNLTR